jgi:UDP-N-acetylglucosamine 2-epimerase (non-hydrolysing)
LSYRLIYTGARDDKTLEPSLFDDLQIPRPDDFLGVDCANLNELTGKVMFAFEKELDEHPADVVIVVDDLASTMAAAIVTKKKGIALAHLVAGTRSFDIKMPKEINRLVIDGLSDLLFTAGAESNRNTGREGVESSHVYMVGNILMDTLRFNHSRFVRPAAWDDLGLEDRKYIVFTINRKVLLGNKENLRRMLAAVVAGAPNTPIVAPLRDTARKAVEELAPEAANFHLTAPLSYLEFGYLTAHAQGVITDSGNIAEEATFNGVPCITLNSYTEHIETVNEGTNVLVGEDADLLGKYVAQMEAGTWKKFSLPDRWDGRTAERIIQTLLEYNYAG